MSILTERTSKKIDMVFVFALITLFAATTFVLILIGAKQYRFVTNTMTTNHEERIISSYLAEKIRQNDTANAIKVCDLKGVSALAISSAEEDTTYITYIYFHEGALRELVVTENSVFSLSSGQAIIDIQDFKITAPNNHLLCADIIDTTGTGHTLYLPIHCGLGKEDA